MQGVSRSVPLKEFFLHKINLTRFSWQGLDDITATHTSFTWILF